MERAARARAKMQYVSLTCRSRFLPRWWWCSCPEQKTEGGVRCWQLLRAARCCALNSDGIALHSADSANQKAAGGDNAAQHSMHIMHSTAAHSTCKASKQCTTCRICDAQNGTNPKSAGVHAKQAHPRACRRRRHGAPDRTHTVRHLTQTPNGIMSRPNKRTLVLAGRAVVV